MPISNDSLKQQLASIAASSVSGRGNAAGGAPPPGGPQGVFDVSNDGVTWAPVVRVRAGTGTAVTTVDGVATITAAALGATEYPTQAAFRAATPPADGTVFRIVSPPGEYRYSTSSGAGWADDGDTLLKPDSVILAANGRAFSTKASEHAATFAAARAMKGLLGRARHVHIESASVFGDGAGGVFDVKDNSGSAYASDDAGTQLLAGTVGTAGAVALIRRDRNTAPITPKWWGGAADYNRTAGTGGTNDNAAIQAARNYAVANKRVLTIPDGNWKLTAPITLVDSLEIQCESFDKCIIHCTCNTPLLASSAAIAITIKGGTWLATGGTLACCFDLWGTFNSEVDIAIGGPWTRGFQCYRDAGSRAAAGYWYSGSLRIRDFNWRPATHDFAYPGHPGLPIYLVGELIDLRVHPEYSATTNTDVGCHIEHYTGATTQSHSIHIEGLVGGNGSNHKPDKGVYVKGVKQVTCGRIYAEACGAGLYAEDCWGVECHGVIDGDSIVFDGCTNVNTTPQLTHVFYIGCTAPKGQGGGFGTAGLTGAWDSDNVDLVDTGFSFQSGQVYSKAGWTYADQENIMLNGDFARWVSGLPWGWTWTIGSGAAIVQCGTGQSDTTKTSDASYCAHLTTTPSSVISGIYKLTGPLGDQYLGSTVSFQAKIKRTSGTQIMKITNSSGVASGDLWMQFNNTPAEDGFAIFTGQCKITTNEQSGLYLVLAAVENSDTYIGSIEVHFGRQVCRKFAPPRRTVDGSLERNAAGNLILSSATIPGSTDPFYGKAYLERDFALNTGTDANYGWTYSGGIWKAFGTTEEDELITQIRRVDVSNKIASLVLGTDFTGSGAWKARIGTDCASAGAAQASVGAIRNRQAAVFSTSGGSQGYTLPVSCAEYWAAGRWDLGGNFVGLESLIGGAGTGPRLMGSTGSANLINDSTITRDNASSVAVDTLTRIWRSTDTATADVRHIGSYGPNVANNWIGPIGLAMAVTTAFTAEEADAIYTLIKNYFAK
jgi:hypothetical protein